MPDEERLRAHLHDTVGAGESGRVVLAGLESKTAQRIIDVVLADYVAELTRVMNSSESMPFGIDIGAFMNQYDQLWRLKLQLEDT